MSKLDELLGRFDNAAEWWTRQEAYKWAIDAAEELRRIQARDRRYEELEARLLRLADDDEREAKQHSDGGRAFRAAAAAYRDNAARIRAIREET